jgi:hypothetical protein
MVMKKSKVKSRKFKALLFAAFLSTFNSQLSTAWAQQAQAQQGQPLYAVNAKYVQGVGPGYWPTAGAGLTLNIAAGTAICGNLPVKVDYAGGTLTMTNAATNYVYLDPVASCVPAKNTTGFTAGLIPLAQVVAAGGVITGVTDVRTWFVDPNSLGPVIRADLMPGADAGAQIFAAIAALPSTGGTVDARRLPGAQTIGSQLLLNKANVTILFNPGATYTLPTTSGLQAGILVTADNVHLLGEGTIFQATKALADDFTDYWLVRVSDADEEVSGFQSKGIDYRLTVTGTTTTEKRMGCVNLYAATTARGIVDFELAGNSCRTSAPDIGTMQKWYGFSVEGEDVAALTARIIKRGKIHHNTFHECDGRVIQVYHGQQIDVESNIVTDMAPGDTYGPNEVRFIGTDDSTIVDNVITIGSTGRGNCLYIGGVANIAGDESKNITVSGNTCVHRGAVGSGYGLHIIGLQDGTITSNTFVNVNATGATRGIKIENVAGLTNQDIFIVSNRIRGFSAWQVDIGTEAVRTVVGVNYLGRTAAGLSQFLNDTGVGTRYLGWEYDKQGVSTGASFALLPSSTGGIGIGAFAPANRLFYLSRLYYNLAASPDGLLSDISMQATTGPSAYAVRSVRGTLVITAANTQNWTDPTSAVRAVSADPTSMTGATGTITGVSSFISIPTNAAGTWTNLYGLRLMAPAGAGTIINKWSVKGEAGAGIAEIADGIKTAKSIVSGVNTVTFSATPTFDASLGNTQKITLTDNVTSSTLSNATAGETINFLICQDGTGSRTFVWPANVLGGMTIGSTVSTCSAQNFIFDGTNAYAVSSGVTNM